MPGGARRRNSTRIRLLVMRPVPSAPSYRGNPPSPLPIVAVGVVVVYRAVVFAAALLMGQWVAPTRSFPVWVTAIQMAAFVVPSVLLLGWGRRDSPVIGSWRVLP